ncbi:MAG TPA: protein kinase [Longimicrobiales bacterium]|nr:protein kinase [Longimicrobiales bacterium]
MATDPRWDRVWALFEAALEVEGEDRARLLAGCGEPPDVVDEVRSLLEAHGREGGILDQVVAAPAHDPDQDGLEEFLSRALQDRYRVVEELGRGGMARVYLAWERKHQRRVVLKVLQPGVAALHGTDRFQREIELVARLAHPHIVNLIDSGVVDGLAYYVMPYVDGTSLREELRNLPPGGFPLPRALSILSDVASALEHAHGLGVIHRDLKPDNILLAGQHAYLLDFGVARALTPAEGEDDAAAMTRHGDFLGTPRYAAPEQVLGLPSVDARADLYAWGVVAHEVLTGEPPRDPMESAPSSGSADSRMPLRRRSDLPRAVAELVERCLARDPGNRPGSAAEILEVLAPHGGTPYRGATRVRRGWRRRAAVAGLGLAAGAAGWALSVRSPSLTTGLVAMPVAVAPFENQTGDPSLDLMGRFAGDWVTQGLQQVERLTVIPWTAAVQAAGGGEDPVAAVASRTGAGTVVRGAFYDVGGRLQFRAEVVDARSGVVLSAPDPVSAHRDSSQVAIGRLRDRISGSLAVATDSRLAGIPGLADRPPTFDAYQSFDRGLEHYLQQDYQEASKDFLQAWDRDTTFATALVYAATTLVNAGGAATADSLLNLLEGKRDALSALDNYRWEHLRAYLDGDGEGELRALRRAFELGPGSRAGYNLAMAAISMNRPREALDVLERLDPDRGELQGWAQYWTQLAHARHLLGLFPGEAEAAREMRRRHPERRIAWVLEARALAAGGAVPALEGLLAETATLSPDTYWSHGAALVVAAEELRAHGHPGWEGYLEEARRWLAARSAQDPDYNAHRYWLASAAYDQRRWDEARTGFLELSRDVPGSDTYRGMAALALAQSGDSHGALAELGEPFPYDPGEYTGYRARIVAAAGDANEATALLSQALQHGWRGFPWVHASGFDDFAPVLHDTRVAQLLMPRR